MSGLISADELAALASEPDVVLLEVRSGPNGVGRAAFEAGHVPGARHTDYAADGWRRKVGDVPGLLPDAAHRARLFGRLGLTPEQRIVVVPEGRTANDFAAAARVFWTLRVSGYRPHAILDGGAAGGAAEGRALEQGAPRHAEAGDAAVLDRPGQRADADDVLAALAVRGPLIDGRAPSYFRGEEKAEQARAAGHIPGAINIDYVEAFDAARGRLRPLAELQALFSRVPPLPVISYCNTGHTAALNWFVLSEMLGRPARLYDGSMTGWTQDPAHPVARSSP
mgnify:CR=1 FL=1